MAAINTRLLPLAVIYRNVVYRNHIVEISDNNIKVTPFENECEATRFLPTVIIVANKDALSWLDELPEMGERYVNIDDVAQYMAQYNLLASNDEESTFICADSSSFKILSVTD